MLSSELPIWVNTLLLLIGLAIVTKGADKFVDSAVVIAEKTRVLGEAQSSVQRRPRAPACSTLPQENPSRTHLRR